MACPVWPRICQAKEGFGSNMGCRLSLNECFHAPTGYQGRKHQCNVSFRTLHFSLYYQIPHLNELTDADFELVQITWRDFDGPSRHPVSTL